MLPFPVHAVMTDELRVLIWPFASPAFAAISTTVPAGAQR
jgi:hypothetical protein